MADYLWWRDGVIYQVYPRSFADSNADGLGDLPGLISKLDYLADLGVDAIWLSPPYPSPDADFGYDVSDHCAIDPRFGTMQDFEQLVSQAHQRGLHIILDLVLNHTSDQHTWFKESRSSKDNPKRDWYLWREKPNNWQAVFGGRGWKKDPLTGQYYYHMFLAEQPDLNWRNPQVRQAQLDVVRFWLKKGVDGFRLDVFNLYFKDATFKNNPWKPGLRGFDRQDHLHDTDQPEMLPLLAELRQLLDKYPQTYAVGETFMSNPRKTAGYVSDQLLHAAFSFDFTSGAIIFPWNPGWLLRRILEREMNFQGQRWPTTVMGNHDTPRAASRYSHGKDDTQARLAIALLLTLRGTPFLYYGEEIGMRQLRLRRDQIMDPPGKRFWPIFPTRDGCRGPMQWDGTLFAGFSSGEPWLPVHPDYIERNVARQRSDPGSLWNFTRSLISLRKNVPALRHGDFSPLKTGPRVMAYTRQFQGQTVLVLLNFSGRQQKVQLDGENLDRKWKPLLPSCSTPAQKDKVILPPGAAWLLLSEA